MANRLKVAMIQALVTLWQQGWSQREIGRKLGVDRETVGRYVRQLRLLANPPSLPTGSAASSDPNPANLLTGSARTPEASRPLPRRQPPRHQQIGDTYSQIGTGSGLKGERLLSVFDRLAVGIQFRARDCANHQGIRVVGF